jgi:F0F1-type ATP synthase delta subunit
MAAAYPEGIVPPEALPTKESRESNEPTPPPTATGATAPPEPAPTGATAAPEPATGATAAPEPSPTGATAAPEPSPTGATAAPAPSPTGATAEAEPKLTDDQLDAAQKKMTVAAGTAFKHVRNENADLKAEAAKLRAELDAAAKGPPVTNEEVEKLRTENAGYKERLAAVDYQNSEEFASTISRPLEAVDQALGTLAAKYNVDAGELRAALAQPDANKRSDQLSELSKEFNRLDMQRFDSSILDYDKLNAEKQRVLQTAFQRQEEERRNAQAARVQSAREIEANWKSSLTNSLNKLTAESPIFAKTEDEVWDKAMGERIAKVQAVDLGKVSPEAVARAFYKSEALDLALGLVTDLVKKNSEQDAMITKLRGSTPVAGGGTPPAAPVGPTGPTGGASFMGVMKEGLRGILPP